MFKRIDHIELLTTKPERAERFYTNVLGFRVRERDRVHETPRGPLDLVYLVTNEYDGSDELGFAWDDPAVDVPWPNVEGTPDGRPILSGRDGANPPLAELAARLRADQG